MSLPGLRSAAWLSAVVVGGLLFAASAASQPETTSACAPSASILASSVQPHEAQAKALNDRGDVVGFADAVDPKDKAIHAVLWKNGKAGGAVDLGLLPGYVSSEAYGVNNDRVVYGVLYDKQERRFPFRWEAGRMKLLQGPGGKLQQAEVPAANTVNEHGEIVGTLIVAGQLQAVHWSREGKATRLPPLPGHTWTFAFSINDDGVVSGWSRKLPNEDGAENPVLWDAAGKVVPLKTVAGRADGIAEATNSSGLTVGYLGNLGTDDDPERDNATVWQARTSAARRLGAPAPPYGYSELVDVNDHGQAAGMSGTFTKDGFTLFTPALWQTGWTSMKPLPIPAAVTKSPVVVAGLTDVNASGGIVGNVYGLTAKDFSKLSRIDAVVWRCAFSR